MDTLQIGDITISIDGDTLTVRTPNTFYVAPLVADISDLRTMFQVCAKMEHSGDALAMGWDE